MDLTFLFAEYSIYNLVQQLEKAEIHWKTHAQVHELKKEGEAEKVVRAAFDAAAMNPAEKTISTFVACGGDSTVNAGDRKSAILLMF